MVTRSPAQAAARALIAAATLLLGSGTASATDPSTTTLYRWVDSQGVVHYSDTPQPGATTVQLQSAQGYAPPPTPAAASTAATSDQGTEPVYQSCGISQPSAEESFYAPDSVVVSVQVSPALRAGDQVTVTFDGTPLPQTAGPLSYVINQPDRGAHSLSVEIHDQGGTQLCTGAPVTFYVRRPSLLSPQSPARGH